MVKLTYQEWYDTYIKPVRERLSLWPYCNKVSDHEDPLTVKGNNTVGDDFDEQLSDRIDKG